MSHIHVPTFPNISEAAHFAEHRQPLKRALEDFANRDVYGQYGDMAKKHAMLCWEAAAKGDELTMLRHQKALSRALPNHLFSYPVK